MRNTLMRACLGVAVAAGTVAVVGCTSSPESKQMERRTSAIDTTGKLRKTLSEAYMQVQATEVQLAQLSGQEVGNLDNTYSSLRNNISKNRSLNEKIASSAQDLNTQTTQQLADWSYEGRTISDENLRQKSVTRQEEVSHQQSGITQQVAEARAAYTRYIRQLDDIAAYAAQDLTPRGMVDMRAQTQQANQAADNVKKQFMMLDGRLDQFAEAWGYDIPLSRAQAAGANVDATTQPSAPPTPSNK